jgi:hypothetical protein
MRVPTVTPPGTPAGASRCRGRCTLRKRRRLPLRGAPCEIQFFFQSLVLAPQPFVFSLHALALLTFPIALTFCALRTVTPSRFVRMSLVDALGHATFMADSRNLYKYGILD